MAAPTWLKKLLTLLVKLGKAGGYIDPSAQKRHGPDTR